MIIRCTTARDVKPGQELLGGPRRGTARLSTRYPGGKLREKWRHKGSIYLKVEKGDNKPITITQAYRIIVKAGKKVGLTDIGTHTMRKTFGYFHYQQFHDVALLQTIFNHSSPSITLRYVGINQEKIDDSYRNFSL